MSKKAKFRILARHKWVEGAIITESVRRDDATDENGVSIRRFTATIRGFRNWKIYEGSAPSDIVRHIIKYVSDIRDKIDNGDNEVFKEPNIYRTTWCHKPFIDKLMSVTPSPGEKWISADQLPANVDYGWSDRFLICQFKPGDRRPMLLIASYNFLEGQWRMAMRTVEHVTHYQPLPAYPDFPEETK